MRFGVPQECISGPLAAARLHNDSITVFVDFSRPLCSLLLKLHPELMFHKDRHQVHSCLGTTAASWYACGDIARMQSFNNVFMAVS